MTKLKEYQNLFMMQLKSNITGKSIYHSSTQFFSYKKLPTPYAVLSLFATRITACTGGIRVSFMGPYFI